MFKPGQSGNPAGRPKGSRNKLAEDFVADACQKWQQHGAGALDAMATSEPADDDPAIYEWREFASAGGLMSYGSGILDAFRLLGDYTGLVLKGANPKDLPVQRSVKIELVLNLRTAKTMRLTFPLYLLGRADEVME